MIDAPQIEPVSTLVRNYISIFAKLKNGPVFLAQHSKPAAVLVSVEDWKATVEELKRARRTLEMDRQFAEARAGNYVDYDDLDKELAAMNARTHDKARS